MVEHASYETGGHQSGGQRVSGNKSLNTIPTGSSLPRSISARPSASESCCRYPHAGAFLGVVGSERGKEKGQRTVARNTIASERSGPLADVLFSPIGFG